MHSLFKIDKIQMAAMPEHYLSNGRRLVPRAEGLTDPLEKHIRMDMDEPVHTHYGHQKGGPSL